MPDITAKLGLKKPLGTETVTRQSFNDNWDLIDQNAASQSQVDEPFYLKGAVYDSGNNRIVCTFGKGQANFAGTLVAKSADFNHYITGPVVNTSYYLYMKNDGTIAQNTTGAKVDSAVQIWKVTTGASVNTITTTDLRGRLAGASAAIVQKALDDHAAATDPHSQYATDTDLATHAAANGGVHGITGTIESVAGAQAKVDAVQTNLDTHKSAAMLDHPDNSVTDTKIGNRTINQALSSPSNTGTLTSLLSWLAGRIKGIMGTTNWFDTPPTTLTNVKTHIDAAAPHSGHETPTGSQSKVDAHSSTKTGVHGAEAGYLAKTGRSDQLVSFNDLADKPSTYPAAPHDHDDRYYTEIELGATTDSASGADKIGSTAISGITGATVQSQLESLKELVDGKAVINHGNHVPSTQTVNNAVFLRNDNTWATVTPANIGAATSGHNHDTTYAAIVHTHDDRYYTEAELGATTDAASGADKIGSTAISGVTGTTVQSQLESLKVLIDGKAPTSHNHDTVYAALVHDHNGIYYTEAELGATTDSASGADKIGSTSISGVTGTTVQTQLESLKGLVDGKAAVSHGYHVPAPQTANNAVYLRNDNTWQTITPTEIGAAAASHGNHVPTTQTANNAVFLRNDNTWQTVAPANIGALPTSHASSSDHDGRYYTETEADSRFSPISHGNHVPAPQTANNAVYLRNDNTWQTVTPENIGAATSGHNHDAVYATIGHTHADATDVASGFMSAAEHTKLAGIASGAEVNQNAFANVKVNGTTIAADSETDTLELVAGTGMALTPDAANDKVTFAVSMSDSLHGNRGGGALHADATTTTDGFMSAGDKVIQGAMQNFIENGFSPFVSGSQVRGGVEVVYCSDPRITYKGTYILETLYQGKSSDGTLMNIPNDVNNELNLPFIGTGIIFVTFADMYNRSWYYSIDDGPITKLDVPISTPAMHRVKTPIVSGLSYGSHNLRMYPSGIDRPEPRYVDSFEIVQTIDKSINIDAGIQYTASKNATVNAITITHSEPTAGQKGRCDAVVVNADGITSIITGTDGLSELGYRVEQTGRISRRYRNRKEINENLVKVWTNLTDAVERVYGTSDGYQWASLTTSDTICIGFFGTGLDVICETGPGNGILGIKVDAGSETTIDLYSATTIQQVRKNVLTGQALGWHTVTLRVTGTKNASASSAWIKIDAFDIYMPKTPDIPAGSQILSYDTICPPFVSMSFPVKPTSDQEGGWVRYDDDVCVRYTGTWYDYWTASDYGGVEKYSPNAGATAEFASVGTCFRVIGPIGNAGQAEILFDGVSQGTYNWYSATAKEQMVIWQSAIVPLGVHTVTVRVLGTHTGGTSNNVDIDAFEVYRPLYVQDVRNLNPVKESTLEDLQYTPPTGMNKDLYLFDAKSALDAALTMDGVEYGENAKGIYWRFPNGLALAVINGVSGASSSATQIMGLYLPIPMLDGYRPFVDLEGVSSAGNGFVTTWAYQNFTPTSFTIAHSSYISQTIQIRAFVIGRWK